MELDTQLDSFFDESTWSTMDLLKKEDAPVEMNESILNGILDLSGLSKSLSPIQREGIVQSLTEQLNFITKLHSIELPDKIPHISRLVDDKGVELLDFDGLMEKISKNERELSKGEIENSWNPLSLPQEHQNKYFLVKEGLVKNNK